MKLLLVSVGSVLAYSCNNKLPSLRKACAKDYQSHCSHVDKTNLVSVLTCGKNNQADLKPECMAEIQKDFPAVFACTDDLSTYCPSFGRVSVSQWGDDNDDDDDAGHRHNRHSPSVPSSDSSKPNPMPPMPPAVPSEPEKPVPVQTELIPADASSESYTDYFAWDYYLPDDFAIPEASNSASSTGIESLHSRKSEDSQQCFMKSYSSFSAPCLNAIAEQWATVQAAKGAKDSSAPSADEAYSMMAPPVADVPQWKKMNRSLFYAALAFFVCTLVTCLCCCCRRCKKSRRAARIVPAQDFQEVALSPLPEVVAVPMAAPTRYVPLATPVPAARSSTPSYIPYTGQGLSAYVPLAQPVHV